MNLYWRSILVTVVVGAYVACAPVNFEEGACTSNGEVVVLSYCIRWNEL